MTPDLVRLPGPCAVCGQSRQPAYASTARRQRVCVECWRARARQRYRQRMQDPAYAERKRAASRDRRQREGLRWTIPAAALTRAEAHPVPRWVRCPVCEGRMDTRQPHAHGGAA